MFQAALQMPLNGGGTSGSRLPNKNGSMLNPKSQRYLGKVTLSPFAFPLALAPAVEADTPQNRVSVGVSVNWKSVFTCAEKVREGDSVLRSMSGKRGARR
jgi:hypothetical protein